jgi:hypothetical protein
LKKFLTEVIMPANAVKFAAGQAAALESIFQKGKGKGRYGPISRQILCLALRDSRV